MRHGTSLVLSAPMTTPRVLQGTFRMPPQRATVQARGAGASTVPSMDELASLLPRSTGRTLPATIQQHMEAVFAADFSNVRVHEGPQADSIGAIAFTLGNDIYFAPGRFQPETAHGRQLLGHELTHVLQQRAGRVRAPGGGGIAVVHDTALEAEADRMGHRAAAAIAVRANGSLVQAAGRGPVSAAAHVGPPPRAGERIAQPMAATGAAPRRFAGPPAPPPIRWAGSSAVQPALASGASRPVGTLPRGRVVQCTTDILDKTWRDHHKGTVALNSGSTATIVHTYAVNGSINAIVTEKDLNHFLNGHTIREFSFETENIERSGRSTFWPETTTRQDVISYASAVLTSLKDRIIEAVGQSETINERKYKHGGIDYVLSISTDPDSGENDPFDDLTGNWLSGTARLQQFYPISGTGISFADELDLKGVKARLGK
ncbi:MAG: DUF4157 domain-containing protein [Rhodospirillales bacterium]|nr:DUF4157 domain-containing protein [Rhodospirillales bacterium]